tara:strand:- start:43 stop:504 length:462 start_codon:yes stop_codon:yes gene_type:complete
MYSTKDLQDFVNLKTSKKQLAEQTKTVHLEILKLQLRENELKLRTLSIMEKLERYNELENVKEMFNFLEPEERIGNIRPNYVTQEQKKALLLKLFSDYRVLNPRSTRVPFSWLKKTLDNQYNIKTRSVSNFFTKILPQYKKTGGKRNRCVIIP